MTPLLRVVLDPNVLVSAFISAKGFPFGILLAWLRGEFELIISPQLLSELEAVLHRSKFRQYRPVEDVDAYIHQLRAGTLVEDTARGRLVPQDEDDDYVVALAETASAHYLVSGDSDFMEAATDIPVLSP